MAAVLDHWTVQSTLSPDATGVRGKIYAACKPLPVFGIDALTLRRSAPRRSRLASRFEPTPSHPLRLGPVCPVLSHPGPLRFTFLSLPARDDGDHDGGDGCGRWLGRRDDCWVLDVGRRTSSLDSACRTSPREESSIGGPHDGHLDSVQTVEWCSRIGNGGRSAQASSRLDLACRVNQSCSRSRARGVAGYAFRPACSGCASRA